MTEQPLPNYPDRAETPEQRAHAAAFKSLVRAVATTPKADFAKHEAEQKVKADKQKSKSK